MSKRQFVLASVSLFEVSFAIAFMCYKWPTIGWPILATLGLGCLVTLTVIAILFYGRMHGVNIAQAVYEMRLRREEKATKIKLPYGR